MSTKNIELVVPFSFCEKCQACQVESITYDVTSLDDKGERLKATHICKYHDICVNAVKLYMEKPKDRQSAHVEIDTSMVANHGIVNYKCSNCGREFGMTKGIKNKENLRKPYLLSLYKYCYYCGSKMEDKEIENE